MLTLLTDVKKTKKKLKTFLATTISGIVISFIVMFLITFYYNVLKSMHIAISFAIYPQELAILEFLWMIFVLLAFFFLNLIIWYYISYQLSKKSIKTLTLATDAKILEEVCYSCGIKSLTSAIEKRNNQGVKHSKLFSIEGNFCNKCFQNYSQISLGTIIMIPIIYFLYLFSILFTSPILMALGLPNMPNSYWYLYSMIFPVFILSIFPIILYYITVKVKISKIYGRNQQKL